MPDTLDINDKVSTEYSIETQTPFTFNDYVFNSLPDFWREKLDPESGNKLAGLFDSEEDILNIIYDKARTFYDIIDIDNAAPQHLYKLGQAIGLDLDNLSHSIEWVAIEKQRFEIRNAIARLLSKGNLTNLNSLLYGIGYVVNIKELWTINFTEYFDTILFFREWLYPIKTCSGKYEDTFLDFQSSYIRKEVDYRTGYQTGIASASTSPSGNGNEIKEILTFNGIVDSLPYEPKEIYRYKSVDVNNYGYVYVVVDNDLLGYGDLYYGDTVTGAWSKYEPTDGSKVKMIKFIDTQVAILTNTDKLKVFKYNAIVDSVVYTEAIRNVTEVENIEFIEEIGGYLFSSDNVSTAPTSYLRLWDTNIGNNFWEEIESAKLTKVQAYSKVDQLIHKWGEDYVVYYEAVLGGFSRFNIIDIRTTTTIPEMEASGSPVNKTYYFNTPLTDKGIKFSSVSNNNFLATGIDNSLGLTSAKITFPAVRAEDAPASIDDEYTETVVHRTHGDMGGLSTIGTAVDDWKIVEDNYILYIGEEKIGAFDTENNHNALSKYTSANQTLDPNTVTGHLKTVSFLNDTTHRHSRFIESNNSLWVAKAPNVVTGYSNGESWNQTALGSSTVNNAYALSSLPTSAHPPFSAPNCLQIRAINSDDAYIGLVITPQTKVYARIYFYLLAWSGRIANDAFSPLVLYDASGNGIAYIRVKYITGTTYRFHCGYKLNGIGDTYTTSVEVDFSPVTWYQLELMYDSSGTGSVEFRVDGSTIASSALTSASGEVGIVRTGAISYSSSAGDCYSYYDKVALDSVTWPSSGVGGDIVTQNFSDSVTQENIVEFKGFGFYSIPLIKSHYYNVQVDDAASTTPLSGNSATDIINIIDENTSVHAVRKDVDNSPIEIIN